MSDDPDTFSAVGLDEADMEILYGPIDEMLAAAFEHARRGRPVFPLWWPIWAEDGGVRCACGNATCDNNGKHPITEHGFKDATTDRAQIRAWWRRWPRANIGIPTGRETFDVVDVDPDKGGDGTLVQLERRHGPLPETAETLTGGGGRHLKFWPSGLRCSNGKLGDGLDTRGEGGYIVAAPSVHRSGRRYVPEVLHALDEVPLAPLPAWLLAAVNGTDGDGHHTPAPPVEDVIPEGQRNGTLASLAGTMRRRGMGTSEIAAALLEVNRLRCRPPLAEAEVRAIAESIGRYEPDATPDGGAEEASEAEPPVSGPKILIGSAIATAVVTEPDWIVEALFSHQHQHLIVGESEGAKTWSLFDLGLAISDPAITTFLDQPVRRHGRVAIESWEQGQAEDLRRLHKLARGHGRPRFDEVILISETPGTLNDESYFTRRFRELQEWGVVLYALDSLSEAAGIELNDNTAYTAWWRTRIKPLLTAGIMVIATHLTGHIKPGIGRTREAVVRNATQIRALSTQVIECRRMGDTTFKVLHNKHRNSTGLPFGTLELAGALEDPWIVLRLSADAPPVPAATKEVLARQRLIELGKKTPNAWLTRKTIDAELNHESLPKAQRLSKRSWEPALASLTADMVFETGKQGNAHAWRWVGPPSGPSHEPDDAPDDDAAHF
ncbi:MAG TPA: bifunctional DNA primase/polymerase [Candidatus Methylomirabilis sp.]|nr:bifunctional DNA primase/polymerase [Candidatus Methylomirabilis sp.]